MNDNFKPVPSLGNLYEVNEEGLLRSVKTKQMLTPVYQPYVHGKKIPVTGQQLLKEVFGIDYKPRKFSVTIEKNGITHTFFSHAAAVEFISQNEFYSESRVSSKFLKRDKNIYGWNITYSQ